MKNVIADKFLFDKKVFEDELRKSKATPKVLYYFYKIYNLEKDINKIKKLCLKKFPNPINKSIKPLQNTELFDYELSVRNIVDDKQILILCFKICDILLYNK